MTDERPRESPLLRRVGDIIQAIAVLAIAGLAVAVIDLRVTYAREVGERKVLQMQMASLERVLTKQTALYESIITRLTTGGFDRAAANELISRVSRIESSIERHRDEPDHKGAAARLLVLEARVKAVADAIRANTVGKAYIGDNGGSR